MLQIFDFGFFNGYLVSCKSRVGFKVVFLLNLLFFYSFSYSQEDNDSIINYLQNISLEELMDVEVVSASKTAQNLSEAPSILSVVTEKEIEKMGVTSLVDILKHVPGIETSMGINGDYRVSIRGERRDGNILVLIDGMAVNDFYDGKAIFDFPADFIEKVEIIRGPGSALFGTNALAGVISVFSKKENRSISTAGGSNNTFSANANYFYKDAKTHFSISRGYFSSDGANVNPRSDNIKTKETNRWIKDEYLRASYSRNKFNVNIFGISRRQGAWVGPLYEVTQNSDLKNQVLYTDVSHSWHFSPKLTFTPRIYNSLVFHDYTMQESPDGWRSLTGSIFVEGAITREKYLSVKTGTELILKYDVGENLNFITGLLGEEMALNKYDVTKNYNVVGPVYMQELGHYNNIDFNQRNKTRNILAGYMQGIYNYKILGVTAGFRYDKYNDFGSSFNPRVGFVLRFENLWKFLPFDNIVLKALYGQAFRAPTFKELYDKTNIIDGISGVRGNEDLVAGTVRSTELGLELKQKFYILRFNVFYNNSYNIINVFDPDGTGQPGDYENIGDNVSKGGECELVIRPVNQFHVFVNGSYFNTLFSWDNGPMFDEHREYLNNNPKGDPKMNNIPTFRVNCGVNLNIYKFQLYTSINYGNATTSNHRFVMEERYVKMDPYLLGNFSLKFNATSKFSIMLQGNDMDTFLGIGKTKYSDPEESTNIDLLGRFGMRQPASTFLIRVLYNF